MFLHPPTASPATASLFQSDLDERGYVMNLSRVWAWRPEVQSGFAALRTRLTDAADPASAAAVLQGVAGPGLTARVLGQRPKA